MSTPTDASSGCSNDRIPIGQRLLRAGLLTQAQLAQALREQQQNHLHLGEVCLEHRWVSAKTLYQLMPSHTLHLGEILVARGHLEYDQLRIALAQQNRYRRKLGEILVWRGWLKPDVVELALKEQDLLRGSALTAWQALRFEGESDPPPPPKSEQFPLPQIGGLADPSAVGWAVTDGTIQQDSLPEQVKRYRNRVAELEVELKRIRREQALAGQRLEERFAAMQASHQQQIDELEFRLRQQQIEAATAHHALDLDYQRQIAALKGQLACQGSPPANSPNLPSLCRQERLKRPKLRQEISDLRQARQIERRQRQQLQSRIQDLELQLQQAQSFREKYHRLVEHLYALHRRFCQLKQQLNLRSSHQSSPQPPLQG